MDENAIREEYRKRSAEMAAMRAEAIKRGIDLEGSDQKNAVLENAGLSLESLMGRLRRGEGDTLYETGDCLDGFEVGPGKITVVGAPPGAGKTAITMQFVFAHLQHDEDARVVVANAEMPFDVLVRREITRRSGVPAKALRFANLTTSQLAKVEAAASELCPLVERIEVMQPPFTSLRLCEAAQGKPALVVVDYLQKFASGEDARVGVNAVMGSLRMIALDGFGILALSATSRGGGRSGQGGHDPKNLSLASFKESGEIEFNADACYLLRDEGPVDEADEKVRKIKLDCVKNRHGERKPLDLVFDMPAMRFDALEPDRFSEFDEYEDAEFGPFAGAHH